MKKIGKFGKFLRSAVAVISAAVMCVSMSGCSVEFGTSPSANDKKVVAKPTGGEDTKGMEITYLDFRKQYSYLLEIYDIEDDTAEDIADACTEQRNQIISDLITTKIIMHEANKLGITLTQEEIDEAKASANEQIEAQINYFGSLADYSDLGLEEITDEVRHQRGGQKLDELLEKCAMTRDDLYAWSEEYILSTKLLDEVTKDITREQAKTQAQTYIDRVKNIYEEDPAYYEQSGYSALWVPEGSRLIKHVLVGFDDSLQMQIMTYRNNNDDEGADALREQGAAELEEKVAEVQQKLVEMEEGKITFNEILLEYSSDATGSSMYPDGYLVVPNGTMYVPEFQKAAFVPEKIGDKTVCVSDYGVHVMIYADDAKADPESIESFIDTAYGEMKNDAFQTKLAEWRELYNYEIDREFLRLDFKPETSDDSNDSDNSADSTDSAAN
ncbi:MAG: SurA N-terminal domain-containing protein [Oscillospiraceae bacterium]